MGHWQRWLADRLADDGAQVLYPRLPEPDAPVLADWLLDLRRYAAAMRGEATVPVCHSPAVLLWWQSAVSDEPVMAERVRLVAPPAPSSVRQEPVADFVPDRMETEPLAAGLADIVPGRALRPARGLRRLAFGAGVVPEPVAGIAGREG